MSLLPTATQGVAPLLSDLLPHLRPPHTQPRFIPSHLQPEGPFPNVDAVVSSLCFESCRDFCDRSQMFCPGHKPCELRPLLALSFHLRPPQGCDVDARSPHLAGPALLCAHLSLLSRITAGPRTGLRVTTTKLPQLAPRRSGRARGLLCRVSVALCSKFPPPSTELCGARAPMSFIPVTQHGAWHTLGAQRVSGTND